ncbi:MAG TPA: ClpXP protease specificity-enhancing factor SspB [Thermoanaerobaculia bacterium]|nr:ClpXP protease specificity-enhancing factor SspB [Thermoanaerobaculia bacterium]
MPSGESKIDYVARIDAALREVVRDLLAEIADEGLPGSHHFFLSFDTSHAGVILPPSLHSRYPGEMTVVLQHQFWDLEVEEHQVSVTLQFAGVPQRITVPFAALSAFSDPAAEFGLRFQRLEAELRHAESGGDDPGVGTSVGGLLDGAQPTDDGDPDHCAKVVHLDDFRKHH